VLRAVGAAHKSSPAWFQVNGLNTNQRVKVGEGKIYYSCLKCVPHIEAKTKEYVFKWDMHLLKDDRPSLTEML